MRSRIDKLVQLGIRQKYFASNRLVTLPLTDKEVFNIMTKEENRQKEGINLIPSENHCSKAVLEALGSVMYCKYAEGYPGARYYGGTQYCDEMENLCKKRALEAFGLDPKQWSCNVQSLSGSPANFAIYTALLEPHDRILSLDLPHGGHLSHGYQTPTKKVSAVSKFFEVLPYRLNEETELIDYEKLDFLAKAYRPKLIVAGASAYSRLIDFQYFRKVCDSIGAYLLADISHTAGLMSAQVMPCPFDYADIVMTTTHKSLRGPRGALIFYRIGVKSKDKKGANIEYDLQRHIDAAVFPALQGGPHFHTISAITVALEEAKTAQFKQYAKKVIVNSQRMAEALLKRYKEYQLVSGGTDNHMVLVNMKSKQIDGARAEALLEQVNIYANKNTVPKDKSALVPTGLRLGSPPMTSRGLEANDFEQIVEFIDRAVKLSLKVKEKTGPKVADYKKWLLENASKDNDIVQLRNEVIQFAKQFPLPGVDD